MSRACNVLLVLLCLHCLTALVTSAWPHRRALAVIQSLLRKCIVGCEAGCSTCHCGGAVAGTKIMSPVMQAWRHHAHPAAARIGLLAGGVPEQGSRQRRPFSSCSPQRCASSGPAPLHTTLDPHCWVPHFQMSDTHMQHVRCEIVKAADASPFSQWSDGAMLRTSSRQRQGQGRLGLLTWRQQAAGRRIMGMLVIIF